MKMNWTAYTLITMLVLLGFSGIYFAIRFLLEQLE